MNNLDCLVDSFNKCINENLLYSILNQSKQLNTFILMNSSSSIKNLNFNLDDLRSRVTSFVYIGIDSTN